MILKKHLIQIENPHGLVPTCMTAKIMRCSHESGMNEAVYCLPGSSCGRGLKPPLESGFKQMQFLCADSTGAGKRGGGGRYCQTWAIWVCAAVNGMVFKQFTLG